MEPVRIIISYCHANREWIECADDTGASGSRCLFTQWERALSDRNVVFWFDREHKDGLHGGEKWEQRIYSEIDRADIAILLMTQDFILSPFIKNRELPRIMERYRRSELLVLPVAVQPSREKDLEKSDLLALQWTPDLSTPLSKIAERSMSAFEEAKIQVLDALERLVEQVEEKRRSVEERQRENAQLEQQKRDFEQREKEKIEQKRQEEQTVVHPPEKEITQRRFGTDTSVEELMLDGTSRGRQTEELQRTPTFSGVDKFESKMLEEQKRKRFLLIAGIGGAVIAAVVLLVVMLTDDKPPVDREPYHRELVPEQPPIHPEVSPRNPDEKDAPPVTPNTRQPRVSPDKLREARALVNTRRSTQDVENNKVRREDTTSVNTNENMVWIEGGTFMMGSEDGGADEKPVHEVTVDGFFMDKTEVTQEEYLRVMRENPSKFKNCQKCPVENVSWHDAMAYCEKVGNRLPTEAEWEYACRAGSDSKYYWGNEVSGECAWYKDNSRGKTHPVKWKIPNKWGLYDMSGNVWEWCSDWYGEGYYRESPSRNPKGPGEGGQRVVRGGSWSYSRYDLRCTGRGKFNPAARYSNLGFRCVSSR